MSKASLVILAIEILSLAGISLATNHVPAQEWAEYKRAFNKDYTNSFISESFAQYYYAFNKKLINKHNALYERGLRTFKLKVNQFTDMRFLQFKTLFPVARSFGPSYDSPAPAVNSPPDVYDPINHFDLMTSVEDQGIRCNSGWAYAAVKSIELLFAQQVGNMNPSPLSAQNIIDCAGRTAACTNQVPQAAFDYLTQYDMGLHFESDYNNNNTLSEPGMCTPNGVMVTELNKYSRIKDGDDESLKALVAAGFPVVVEFNPTSFEFMHYAEGIFQPPLSHLGSHFMVVFGYNTDPTTGKDYWLLQNSFGTTWGERGLMKLARSSTIKVAKNAIFPSELA